MNGPPERFCRSAKPPGQEKISPRPLFVHDNPSCSLPATLIGSGPKAGAGCRADRIEAQILKKD
jgi:hypothetical protein